MLWTGASLAQALQGEELCGWYEPNVVPLSLARLECLGVSIDSRTVTQGDLFIALHGPNQDGHNYIEDAFRRGATAAMVHRVVSVSSEFQHLPQLKTRDTFEALQKLGGFARGRTHARVGGVTGSVGKTTLKTMLGVVLAQQGRTSFSVGSLNNHWGVPLSLARLPEEAQYAVFEMGMNHAGEIRSLVQQVQPHAAIITRIGDAHIGNLGSKEAICDAKSEIFEAVVAGGTAVLNHDDDFYERLRARASACGIASFLTFGSHPAADIQRLAFHPGAEHNRIDLRVQGCPYTLELKMKGEHNADNALGALAMVLALGGNVGEAVASLSSLEPLAGRGRCVHILTSHGALDVADETYNANPTSMRAAIRLAAQEPRNGRLVLVLGNMVELGEASIALHRSLVDDVLASGASLVLTVGDHMAYLHEAVRLSVEAHHFPTAAALAATILPIVKDGDRLMVKGSNSTGMHAVVRALLSAAHHPISEGKTCEPTITKDR